MGRNAVFLVFIFSLFLLIDASFARDLQVGVSPTRIDLGALAQGSETYSSFSLVTQSQDEILVNLGAIPAGRDAYNKPQNAPLANFSSDADPSGWVSFPANPVVIKPINRSLETLGGSISGWRGAGFNVRVPNDAEPCYYAFQIRPTPYAGAAYETGVSIAAITVVTVFFKVPGACVRDGAILDIQQGAGASGNVEIDTYFKNTGTATINAQVTEMKVYAENGTEISVSKSGAQKLAPGKTVAFPIDFSPQLLEVGKAYRVVSTVSWGTKSVTKSVLLTIERIESPAGAEVPAAEKGGFLAFSGIKLLILIIIILAVSYWVYKH